MSANHTVLYCASANFTQVPVIYPSLLGLDTFRSDPLGKVPKNYSRIGLVKCLDLELGIELDYISKNALCRSDLSWERRSQLGEMISELQSHFGLIL